jgi:hypothetical protein
MPSPNLGSIAGGMADQTLDLQTIQSNAVKLQSEQISLVRDKISLQQDLKLLQLMGGLQPGQADTPDQMAGMMSHVAMLELQAGKVDSAAAMAAKASTIQENSSKIDYRQYRMQNDRFTKFANVLSGVQDSPQGLQQALQTMMSLDPRVAQDPKFQKLAQTPWRPGLVAALRNQVLTEKDKAEISYRNAATDHATAAATVDKNRVSLIKAQERYLNDRDTQLKKVGAIPYKAEQLKAVTDQASRDFPGADPADIRVRSRPLAEDVVKMMQQQRLSLSEASTRVYENAKTTGVFGGLRQMPVVKGSKPGVALPLPAKAEQMQENQWYTIGGVPRLKVGDSLYTEEELAGMNDDEKEALGIDTETEEENPDDTTPAVEK